MDTKDGGLLYPGGVWDVGDRPDDQIGGTVVRLGGVGLGRRGRGVGHGGLGGFGGGDGLRRPCGGGGGGGGGFGLFAPADRPVVTPVAQLEGKLSLLGGGLGGVGLRLSLGGGLGRWGWTPPPTPPLLPFAHPTISNAPPRPLILPPRIPRLLHPSPLCGPEVPRRHRDAAHDTRGLPVLETAQESKAQGWIWGQDAVSGPQGYFVGALIVSPGHPDGPGMRRAHHDVNHLQK